MSLPLYGPDLLGAGNTALGLRDYRHETRSITLFSFNISQDVL